MYLCVCTAHAWTRVLHLGVGAWSSYHTRGVATTEHRSVPLTTSAAACIAQYSRSGTPDLWI